ncbi:MAG TPA: LytTR family DNA-binding domain-containing protein [Thermodesulfobacteriota bacterium]
MVNGVELDRHAATGDLVVQVGPDGRVAWSGGGSRLAGPARGTAFLEWLATAPPVVVAVRRDPGGGLLLTVRPAGPSDTPSGEPAAARRTAGVPRRLVGFKRKRTFLFDPSRALAFELRSGLVHASLDDGESLATNYSVRELTARLAPLGFFRVHRDVIVNLRRVREIERVGQGRVRLVLDTPDAHGFTVSRPASARLRRLLRF